MISLTELSAKITAEKSVALFCHIRPDGDSLGSGFALKLVAEKFGKRVDFVCDSDKPRHYEFLTDFDQLNNPQLKSYDTVISVDCADESRLGKYYNQFRKAKVSINIDHHATNPQFGKVKYVYPDASSTCEVIFNLIEKEIKITPDIATMLYLGLSTDTGHFRHDNSTARAHIVARKLI